jgi:hypothetical protein
MIVSPRTTNPEREEVRDARHRPLQQLALAEHLGGLRPQPGRQPVEAARRRLAGPHQFGEPEDRRPATANAATVISRPSTSANSHEISSTRGDDIY